MALSVIWLSVILGAALGLWQRMTTRATGPIRTFAVVAATLVVGLSLLPHAIESEGLWGLAAAAAGLAVIPALDRLVRFAFRDVNTGDLRLEVGFIGLSVHRFGDGVVMAVDGHGNDLLWAVGAHEIPIVALVTLAYARRGIAEALVRAALLGLVSSLGFWLVGVVPATGHDLHGWADAVAAGLLIHIVADTGLSQELRNGRERTLDVLGGVLGLAMVLLPGSDHVPAPSLGDRMLAHALDTVPWLGLGLVASAALSALGRPRARSSFSVFCIAFGSALGFECVALSAHLLGWPFTALGVAAALALGAGAAVAMRALERAAEGSEQHSGAAAVPLASAPGFGRRWWALLEQRLFRIAGWFLLGLLGASYIDAFVASGELARTGAPAQTVIAAALALASSICAPALVPVVASLVVKGLPPGAALVGLFVGPAAHLLAGSWPKEQLGRARSLSALLALAVLAWGIGALGSHLLEPSASASAAGRSGAGTLDWLAVAALGAVLARRIWQTGIRSWMGASLAEHRGEAGRDHAALGLHAH